MNQQKFTHAEYELMEACMPIKLKPNRISLDYKKKVLDELRDMKKNGVLGKFESEYGSPLAIVTKKNRGIRLWVDYWELNKMTKFDAYLMPSVDEMLDQIGSAQFVSTLDLAKWYWQVPLCPVDKKKPS